MNQHGEHEHVSDDSPDPREPTFEPVAARLGVPVDAILFVLDALHWAPQYAGEESSDAESVDARHCSARELCNAVRLFANDLWNEEAPQVLQTLGIRKSEDVGRIVMGLVDAGMVVAAPDEAASDFVGLCQFGDRAQREALTGTCFGCGYNLKGNTTGICPECGRSAS